MIPQEEAIVELAAMTRSLIDRLEELKDVPPFAIAALRAKVEYYASVAPPVTT